MKMYLLVLLAATAVWAADPKPASARGANDKMEILATVYPGKELVKQLLGDDLQGFIYVVEVTLKPRGTEPIGLDRDHFELLMTDDGQKTRPFAPAQLTGNTALVIKSVPGPTSGIMGQNNGPAWGGIGGPPVMLPGQGAQIGSTTANVDAASAEVKEGSPGKENPLQKVLEAKELPQTKLETEPVKGLLYFPVDGKHKPKNIMLLYRGLGGRIDIEFREKKK
ncbi:MAG: hypothetical protein NW208_02130 [Bryobacter sp.]|nr:hypothetical protein [Bryobacter sp.]